MSARAASRLGWSVWVVSIALAGVTLALSILSVGVEPGRSGVIDTPSTADAVGAGVYFVAVTAFATVGAFVIWRRPGNAIGWVFLAIGAVVTVRVLAAQYAESLVLLDPVPQTAPARGSLGPLALQALCQPTLRGYLRDKLCTARLLGAPAELTSLLDQPGRTPSRLERLFPLATQLAQAGLERITTALGLLQVADGALGVRLHAREAR